MIFRRGKKRGALRAVAADRFDRATFHRLFAERFFLGRFGLLVDEGMAAIVVALEVSRRRFPAEITVDALIIDIEFSLYVFGIFVCHVGHKSNFGVSSASKVGRFVAHAIIFLFDGTRRSRQITRSPRASDKSLLAFMKAETRRTVLAFLVELLLYAILVVGYFFLVLHFLGPSLANLHKNHIPFYALVSVALIIGQAVVLEALTTFLIRLIRGRSE
jgi:hypothetical protein